MKEGRRARRFDLRAALFLLFLCAFLVFGGLYVLDLWRAEKEARAFTDLAGRIDRRIAAAVPDGEQEAGSTSDYDAELAARLAAYGELREENPDFFGWLSIADTRLDYPVMYSPEESERYLRRSFDRQYAASGTPFMDGSCYPGCGNYIVYGHMMRNGSMFAVLKEYASEEFWREHPVICFDTPEKAGEYEVVAAFYSRVYYQKEENVFRYYQYTDLTDPERFEEYMSNVGACALYDTGAEVQYGDELLTLSTCSYHTDNGRFVVVARKSDVSGGK